uniref:Uncharacterized protein n=1 Tax=Canis lupus familiaris TaxID=9615 RepID=A0A8P0TRA7_CANLF
MGPLVALLLLLVPPRAAPAPRARPLPGLLGCLFQDDLCSSSETCVNDGVFGRCQKVPALDTDQYEVPPVVLQRLTATLQRLSHTACRPILCGGIPAGARLHKPAMLRVWEPIVDNCMTDSPGRIDAGDRNQSSWAWMHFADTGRNLSLPGRRTTHVGMERERGPACP